MCHRESFKEFKKAGKVVLEHHFNNHKICGEWCPANKWKENEKQSKKLKYRYKVKPAKLYQQMSMMFGT
jgi:epoxyqueuosine reductase QueG